MQNTARVVPITDTNLLRFAIVRGLKPAIRLHVLQSGAQTLEEVIKAARVAEAALSASAPTDDITKLTDQVAQLVAKLATTSVTTSPATPSVGEEGRKVTFAPIEHRQDS